MRYVSNSGERTLAGLPSGPELVEMVTQTFGYLARNLDSRQETRKVTL